MNNDPKKLTVTVGIPAYNEERNIEDLVCSILKQNNNNFLLEKIIVISDGSTDSTVQKSKLSKDPRVHVYDEKERLGKPARINDIFDKAETDVVILLDADIKIYSETLLENLLVPMIADPKVLAVSGVAEPLPPKNITQKTLTAGWEMWRPLKNRPDAELYRFEGPIRAFKKEVYTEMRFPNLSADDAFSYLYCKSHAHKFAIAKNAIIFYSLPTSFKDYAKQHIRFLGSRKIQSQLFERNYVKKSYVITPRLKLQAFLLYFFKKPFFSVLYLAMLIVPKIIFLLTPFESKSTWKIARSTKINYRDLSEPVI